MTPSSLAGPIAALLDLTTVLKKCEIPFYVVGSFASSVQGEMRATNDLDIVVNFEDQSKLRLFIEKSTNDFIIDDVALLKAYAEQRSYNIFHETTCLKVGLFMNFGIREQEEYIRASSITLPGTGSTIKIASAEDTIVAKLLWYEKSGKSLNTQVRDIQGIVAIQGDRLDRDYLLKRAEKFGVMELFRSLVGE